MSQLKQVSVFHLFCISRNLLIKMRLTPTIMPYIILFSITSSF
ncbi:hypothetical protein T11_16442 [Trichinella zimbabwensis]|uniref:Uncharacterized protein n=1 Tax=Trichinella zimbabwensis TaxID=268475 RepID=A0A0V1DMT0_9BILA|nr:hypothetical protein T11_16442 [Trichinella zimbabwensis]